MADPLDALEAQMTELRAQVRAAIEAGETDRTSTLRARLLRTERAWDALVDVGGEGHNDHVGLVLALPATPASAARDRIHQVLTLLTVPAAPKLINGIHRGLWNTTLGAVTSLRRDEERSWRSAPDSRPFYVLPALHHGALHPVRAQLALSTWDLEQRIVTPASPLIHSLIMASRVANAITNLETFTANHSKLLAWLARDIPGAITPAMGNGLVDPFHVRDAAELALRNRAKHIAADELIRKEAAMRARNTLTPVECLFGVQPDTAPLDH